MTTATECCRREPGALLGRAACARDLSRVAFDRVVRHHGHRESADRARAYWLDLAGRLERLARRLGDGEPVPAWTVDALIGEYDRQSRRFFGGVEEEPV